MNYRHYLLLASLMFFASCCFLMGNKKDIPQLLYYGLVSLATVETVICGLQFMGIINSKNALFAVTGSWVNPNVTALFQAMCFPAALTFLLQERKLFRKRLLLLVLGGILFSLFVLQCRTAIIAAGISSLLISNAYFGWINKIKVRYSLSQKLGLLMVSLFVLVPLCYYGYKIKQHSADGRLLLWKVSAGMIMEKPVTGFGYGMFEHDYNLAQAAYIGKGMASSSEMNLASHINMAYNEFLEAGVEGGVPGLLLLSFFLGSLALLYPSKQAGGAFDSSRVTAYAGVISFIVMSVFNFSLQALPALGVFLIFAAFLCSGTPVEGDQSSNTSKHTRPISVVPRLSIGVSLLLLAGYFGYTQFVIAEDLLQVKRSTVAAGSRNNNRAIEILEPLKHRLQNSECYLQLKAALLFESENYKEAIEHYCRAKALTSTPDLYLKLGACYEQLGQYQAAQSAFQLAHDMVPMRMAPNYALMQLYLSIKDTSAALVKAGELVQFVPKKVTVLSQRYQSNAEALIRLLKGAERFTKPVIFNTRFYSTHKNSQQ